MTPIALAAREAVDAALTAGKLHPSRRDEFLARYLTRPGATQATLDALAAIPADMRPLNGPDADEAGALIASLWPTRAAGHAPAEPAYDALYRAPS